MGNDYDKWDDDCMVCHGGTVRNGETREIVPCSGCGRVGTGKRESVARSAQDDMRDFREAVYAVGRALRDETLIGKALMRMLDWATGRD